jgi:hypothetical protein
MKPFTISCAALLAAISLSSAALASNLVVNGGFETDPPIFDGWTVLEGITNGLWVDTLHPRSGLLDAYFSATRGTRDSLEQSIPTAPGLTYQVSFWLSNPDINVPDNDFSASWNGNPMISLVNVPMSPYTEYTFTALAVDTQSVLRFTGRDQPAALYLDDVSAVVVPEPSSKVLLAFCALSLLGALRRGK